MNRLLLSPVLALLLLLSGCVTPEPGDVNTVAVEPNLLLPTLDITDQHDHRNASAHDVAWNLELLGWNPISPDVQSAGRYNQVVVHGKHAYVSVYNLANGSQPGLAVLDVSGPQPVVVGKLETPDMTPIDVFPSPDGKYVFLAGHRDNRAPLPAPVAQTCTGTPGVNVCAPFVPAGVVMVDVQDPARPREVARYASVPSGAHTVKAHVIGGELYVFIASYGFAYASRLASAVEIARVNFDGPAGIAIEPASRFFAERLSGQDADASVFVHDMWVEEHPMVQNKPLLYVAYWDGGVVVADVSDPMDPKEIADWTSFDAKTYGNVHFTRPIGVIGGRHITMAAPEFGSAPHAGEAYVLDTTDPTKPQLLAKWTLPGDPVNDGNYRFSPHNFDPEPNGTRVVYGHYHGGVWALDLADPTNVTVVGYVFPVPPGSAGEFKPNGDAPNVWNAVWTPQGTLVASDQLTGIYQYRLVSATPGAPPYEPLMDG